MEKDNKLLGDDLIAKLNMEFGTSKPSYHGLMFVITRGGDKIIIDTDLDLYASDLLDGNNLEDNIDNMKDVPSEPGIYTARLRIHSFRSNRPDDPVEYDMNITIDDIIFLKKPIDLV